MKSLPSWEGSGLKGVKKQRHLWTINVFPREREVDWKLKQQFPPSEKFVFPREREVDWKRFEDIPKMGKTVSSLVRGKWIERTLGNITCCATACLPSWEGSGLKGSANTASDSRRNVFPREREVDWKRLEPYQKFIIYVFPREREVDWKIHRLSSAFPSGMSSLVRGKWIESDPLFR